MAENRIRIKIPSGLEKGKVFEVRVRVDHEMESGLRVDTITRKKIPRHYIKLMKVIYGGREVSHMELTPGVSNNPTIGFKLVAEKSGPLKIMIENNKGEKFDNAVDVKVA